MVTDLSSHNNLKNERDEIYRKYIDSEKDNRRLKDALAEASALILLGKSRRDSEQKKGRLISPQDRGEFIQLIDEARRSGAHLDKCCEILLISEETYRRWTKQLKQEGKCEDRRPAAKHPACPNKIGEAARKEIEEIITSIEYEGMNPMR